MINFEELKDQIVSPWMFERVGTSSVLSVFFDERKIGTYDEVLNKFSGDFTDDSMKIASEQFEVFKSVNPQYYVGIQIPPYLLSTDDTSEETISKRSDIYDTLLTGCCLILYGREAGLQYAKRCIEWLRKTDFYYAPASTMFHDAHEGGLVKHTLNVVNNLLALMDCDKFANVSVAQAVLCCLCHDLCKIGKYERLFNWKKERYYKGKVPTIPLGHGAASMYIAQKFFKLTLDMALAIRWHMGEYNCCDGEMNELHSANEAYPLVQLLQFADRLSITKY